jgi:alpha-ketoglutarate-dependent taurine dioxygenase
VSTTIRAQPLKPFGVELDLDLREPLTEAQQDELRRLYAIHLLIVVRDQQLSMDDQVRVLGHLGPLLLSGDSSGEIRHDNGLHTSALAFHTDLAFCREPLVGISLHALEVGETSTRFVNARSAYERLDPELRECIAGLEALNVFSVKLDARNRDADVDASLPRAIHPVVWHQAVTGAPFVYVCENQTDSIVGLPLDESEKVIAALFAALYDPAQILEHQWRQGDIVIWDNLAVQHGRRDIAQHGPRILQRVALGTRGMYEQNPEVADYYNG